MAGRRGGNRGGGTWCVADLFYRLARGARGCLDGSVFRSAGYRLSGGSITLRIGRRKPVGRRHGKQQAKGLGSADGGYGLHLFHHRGRIRVYRRGVCAAALCSVYLDRYENGNECARCLRAVFGNGNYFRFCASNTCQHCRCYQYDTVYGRNASVYQSRFFFAFGV